MMKRGLLSLPVLLVAVLALALGSVGTAAAGGLTKHTVKKIAAKVVDKKASGLSVSHASTADSATAAASATNAAALNGQPASVYLPRIAFVNAGDTSIAAGADTSIGSVNITVPTGQNFLHIVGETTFAGGNTLVSFWYALDQTCNQTVNPGATNRTYASSQPNQQSATVNQVVGATAGVHTVRLCANVSAASLASDTQLSVETVPVGATGGSTISSSGTATGAGTRGNEAR